MEKLVSLCLHCQPVAYHPMSPNGCNTVLSNLLRRWLPSASTRQVSKHHRPPRCYRGPLCRQTYPCELAGAVAVSSPQSLWDITNLSSSLIHTNTSRNDRYSQNENSLVYYPANKSSQQLWHDDTTVRPTKCPLPLRTLLSQSASIYQRQTSKKHFSSSCHHCQLLSNRNMNKLVNNILRRASVSVAEPSHSDTKCDLSQLSQVSSNYFPNPKFSNSCSQVPFKPNTASIFYAHVLSLFGYIGTMNVFCLQICLCMLLLVPIKSMHILIYGRQNCI